MNKIAKIFDVFLIISMLWYSFGAFCGIHEDCHVSCRNIFISEGIAEAELLFSIPKGWKFPQVPKIMVDKSENITNCSFDKKIKVISPTEYSLPFHVNCTKNGKSYLKLSIEIPLCSNICTIISKDLTIPFDFTDSSNNLSKNTILIMLLALLGGLILNLMPCVLPVILMKMRSLVASNKKAAIWGTIIGNYVSFCTFAIFLIFIKVTGESVGWGMHFQSLNFLKTVAVILFVLSLYSFEIISFPIAVQISESNNHRIFLENFISSIVASIIAIPCTAPFLGTAAAFAIQGSAMEMMLIFVSIATGFSLPYILALVIPISMPQGIGKYSRLVKTIANFGVFVTLIWILYLLIGHIGAKGILAYLALFIFSTILVIRKHYIFTAICLILSFFIGNNDYYPINFMEKSNKNIERIIKGNLSESRIIIFNISADWCLTCKYNKINVLNNKEILKLIKEKDILYVEGDMTKKNDFLMNVIIKYGRVGIPFTLVFGPKVRNGILLSEVLTVNELKNAISRASGEE